MNFKRTICIALAFLSVIAFPVANVIASEAVYEEAIVVGYNEGDDMVEDINHVGHEGYGYEILKKIEEVSDLTFEFKKIEGDVFDALDSNEVDLVGLFYDTPERREKYLYMETPLNAVSMGLMVRKEDEFPFANPADINGKTVATYEGNWANSLLDDFLAENDISVEYKIGEIHNYRDQEADLYLMYSSDTDILGYTTVLNLTKRNTHILSNYGNEEMIGRIEDALLKVVIDEGDFFEGLSQKYYPEHFSAFHRNLTAEELAVLRQRPLTVAYEINHSPFTSQNSQGEPDGAIVDLMNELVDMYDFEIEFHPYTVDDPSTYPTNRDITISAIGIQEHYDEYYYPTQSFYSMQMIAMVPNEIAKRYDNTEDIRKASEKIGVMSYLNVNFQRYSEYAVESEFVYFTSFQDLLDAYERGAVDMAIFTESGTTYANSYLKESNHFTFSTDFSLNFHFGIEHSIADEYISLFNVMFDNISSTQYEEMIIANTSKYFFEETFSDFLVNHIHVVILTVALVALGFALFAFAQQRKKEQELLVAHNTDSITGLMAIHKFREVLEELLNIAKPSEYELVSLDIDMFKTINTHYSSEKGTNIIIAIANALKETFENTESYVTRRTADQFLILRKIDVGGSLEEIYSIKILPSIKEVIGRRYNLSMSFGYVKIDDLSINASTLIGQADTARTLGKNSHKTTFIKFDKKMRKQYENKVDVTFRMEQAMQDKEFFVVFQPKVRFDSLAIGGAEALVRWKTQTGDIIYPDAFIPVFEENGFITTLDLFVFEEVCKFIKENETKMNVPIISVNISATTMLGHNIVSRLSDIVVLHDIAPEKIELEITESAMVADESEIFGKLRLLKKLGFSISIDDFGAGVSSLNRLSSLEADVLKLDKDFLRSNQQSKRDFVVVQNIIALAKNLGMAVVAEGVETGAQSTWLKQIKCDYAQGYYFERPIEESSFKELLMSEKVYQIDGEE